jgi:predicted nucleotidyltransferase
MNRINLTNSTHNDYSDTMLQEIIELLNMRFPDRIHSYYIEGSYADNSCITTSDIDLLIVFKENFGNEQEKTEAEALALRSVTPYSVELDVMVLNEHGLSGGVSPNFKMGSTLLYGQDIRSQFPLISLTEWTRDRMHSSWWRTARLFKRGSVITYPLDYPNPSAEFYGYDARKLRLSNGQEVNCTRDLIRLVGWSATAIIAFKAGRYVARKSDCHKIYQECFHDEWGQLLQAIYEQCRGRWNYLIPEDSEERKMLRSLCQRTLAFESHFLSTYKEFLLLEFQHADEQALLQALWVLGEIVFQDGEVKDALRILADDRRPALREAARLTFAKFP